MTHRLLLALLGASSAAAFAAQDDEPLVERSRNTTHLRYYPELDQVEEKASALAKEGRFAEALAIYDQAVARHPNTVVPLDSTRALGLEEYVRGQIAAWPPEGREVCRRRVDLVARHLFHAAKSAGDIEALERLIGQYPYSSLVDDALFLAASLWLDAGEPGKAADALARLLALEGDVSPPVAIARLGLAFARGGQKGRLEDLVNRALRDHAGATVWVGGAERDLAEYLRELARETRQSRPPGAPLAVPGWEMTGGHPSGSRLAEPGVAMSRLAWSAPLRLPQYDSENPLRPPRGFLPVPSSEFRPFFPAVSDGLLYVHDESTLFAYNLFGQRAELLWQFGVPAPVGEIMFENRLVYATTVHEGRVYANLMTAVDRPDDQLGYVRVKFPFPRRALFALDAHTGELLWKLGGQIRSDVLEENATFSTPPAPEGGRLYVGAVKQKLATDPFEHFVLCLDAATGKVLWSTFVASGGTEINLFGNSTRESLGTPVTVGEDSVFYCTNHGAAAAIEKKTGRLRWVHRYVQNPVRPTRSIYISKQRLGWINSPPVAAHGVVVVTPLDAPSAYALDARTGELRWARPRAEEIRTIYGLRGATLVLGGEGLEFLDIRSGKLLALTGPELRGTGRGAVAEDGIYVPALDGLRRVGWDGAWEDRPGGGWGAGRLGGGNLVVVDGALVLATPGAVETYFDRGGQQEAILAELAENPDDPGVLYRVALRLLQAGGAPEAEKLLSRIVEGGGTGLRRPETERIVRAAGKRLYAVRLEAGRAAMEREDFGSATESLDRARAVAPDPASRLEASLLLGRALAAGGNLRRAIEEFQRLLAEAGGVISQGMPVFDLARREIAAILGSAEGREAYAPFEAEAQRLLDSARRDGTAEACLEVFRSFPNSAAAEEALFEAASAHARLGRPEEEIAALRRFLREFAASSRTPEAYARLVRALERKGHTASAAALLRRMARDFPDVKVEEEGGGRVTARAFAERRLRSEAYARPGAATPPPAFSPPLRKVFDHTEGGHRMGVPLRPSGATPAAVREYLFMNYGIEVKAFDLRGGAEAWGQRFPWGVRFAAFLEESLLLAGDRGICRVNPRDGRVEWKHDSPVPLQGFLLTGGYLCFVSSDPRGGAMTVSALDAGRGVPAWTQPFPGTLRSASDGSILRAAGEAVAFLTIEPYQIHLFERETGKRLLEKASFTQDLTPELEYASEGLALVSSRGRFLEAYDLSGGKLKWRLGMSSFALRDVKVSPEGIVLLGSMNVPGAARDEMFMAVVDLENGKIRKLRDRVEAGDARYMQVEGETAYLVSREPDRTIAARAVRLGDLTVLWKTGLGARDGTLFPLVLARDHVAVMTFESGADGRFAYGGALLDRSGRVVQNIRSDAVYDRPPYAAAANDRLVFCVDNRVEVYR